MEFTVKLINRRGWWLVLYIMGMPGLAVGLLMLLQAANPFLQAGVGVVALFGGGWLFWCIEKAIQQPVQISILADKLTMVNQQTGTATIWLFEEITACRFTPEVRGSAALRMTLRSGKKVRLIAHNAGFMDDSTTQLAAMASVFEATWRRFRAL
jgi:hypothetical protein